MDNPQLPPEMLEKLENMKKKIDSLTKALQKEVGDYLMGVTVLPPYQPRPGEPPLSKEEKVELQQKINVLILINAEAQKDGLKLREELTGKINATSKKVDPELVIRVMDILELKDACYDAKYDLIEDVAMSAIFYDPKDFLGAFKIMQVHKSMVLKKFEKYIVAYVAVGSTFRDATSNDLDVFIVIDDTDVKKMTRIELRDRLYAIIRQMGQEAAQITGVKKMLHIQAYILTDFWESIKDASPVIYTFLRDGVPIFDRGIFMPWRLLLKTGRIKPSSEAIDMQMETGEKMIEATKNKLVNLISWDLYHAIMNPAQAAIMLYGIAPPTHKETVILLDEIFVKKEKLLEKKYVDILAKALKYFKDYEHGKLKSTTGKEIDDFLTDAEDYIKRMKKLFEQIEIKREKEDSEEIYNECIRLSKDILDLNCVQYNETNMLVQFKKYIVGKGLIAEKDYKTLKVVEEVYKTYQKNKSVPADFEKIKKSARIYMRAALDYIQRKRSYVLERAKIRFKYGDKFGEVLLLGNHAYVIEDLDATEKSISIADVTKEGTIKNLKKITLEEFEAAIAKVNVPERVFIRESTLASLKSLFGQDIEILINY